MKKEHGRGGKSRDGNHRINNPELQPSNHLLQAISVLASKVEELEFFISEFKAPGAHKSKLRSKIKKIKAEIKKLKKEVKLTNESYKSINVLINTREESLRNVAWKVMGRYSANDVIIEVSGYPIPDPKKERVHYKLVITSKSEEVVLTTLMDNSLASLIVEREFEFREVPLVATTDQIKLFLYDDLKDLAELVAEHGDR